ncbi:MAG: TIGR04255 family protein [Rhodocyclales bacterium]|nr:TIGR04255 family protein [Rhodocyclales bacterium]
MATRLPTKLGKEPLIDAIFELRFSSSAPASVVFPGFLFNELSGDKKIDQLPFAQLPKPFRDADPNLKFAPLSRLDWENYFVNIGDFSVSVSCKYPYPGWVSFRSAIMKTMAVLSKTKIVDGIERYSMKYVDLIPATNDKHKISLLNFNVSIAGHKLEKEPFQLRIEVPRGGFTHAVQLVSSAQATLHTGQIMEGLIVDVDTFANQGGVPIQTVLDSFDKKLDLIHAANKEMFFDCLTPEAIQSLEPNYE